MLKSYKELIVWQKAYKLSLEIYKISKTFPKSEIYGLSSQIRRSAISIPSNIAEGYSRKHTGEYLQFLSIALGSASELETQLMLARDLKYISEDIFQNTISLLTEVSKMLNTLITSLKTKPYTLTPKSCSSGQVFAIVIMILMFFVIAIGMITFFLHQESKWTIKEKRSTTAFHLAEAGLDRGYWKLIEKTDNWDNILKGQTIPLYDGTTTFTDVPGGEYKIYISSMQSEGDEELVRILSVGRDLSTNEVRAIEAIYKRIKGLDSAVTVGKGQEWKKGFWVHWAPVISYGNIDLKGDQDDVYWPKRLAKGMIDPWDTTPPTNLYPPGSSEADENYCGWAFNEDLGNPPEIDLGYYREKAKQTVIPYPDDPDGIGTISSDKDPWKNAAGQYTGYFPDASEVIFKGYNWQCSTGVIFIENATKNVKLEKGSKGKGKAEREPFLRLEALVSARGNMHLHSDGITNYSVKVPKNAYKQYLAGKPRNAATDTADHVHPDTSLPNEYPGDLGYHNSGDGSNTITLPSIFDTKKYTKNTITATGVAFHGFLYAGAEQEHCAGGKNIVVGCVYAKGGLDVDTIIIYYDAEVGESVKLTGNVIRRKSWKEVLLKWPTQ